jgi:hypothetical protein
LKKRKQAKFKKKSMPQSKRWSKVEVRQKDEEKPMETEV